MKIVSDEALSRFMQRLRDWIPFAIQIEPLQVPKIIFDGEICVKDENGEITNIVKEIDNINNRLEEIEIRQPEPITDEEIKNITQIN